MEKLDIHMQNLISHMYKNHSKWISDLTVRPERVKLLGKKNGGKLLLSIGLGNDVLDMTPKTQTIKQKINK